MITPGAIGHVEWRCTDLARAKRFYGGLFGWEFRPWGKEYLLFRGPGYAGGGFARVKNRRAVRAGGSPTAYVEVKDIEATLRKARRLGGSTERAKTEIPGMGWFAHLRDPDGNRIGLYEERPR